MSTAEFTGGFTAANTVINRDRWGRPLIVPVGGGKAVAHTRPSSLGSALEDMGGLIKWSMGRAAVGLARRPDLLLAVQSLADPDTVEKSKLYRLAEQAKEAAGASAAATTGTALHSFADVVDRGETLPEGLGADVVADIAAYQAARAGVLTPVHIEPFVVCDELTAAGSPDRLELLADPAGCCTKLHVTDLKTGKEVIKYGSLKIAVQMAVYAHADLYDVATGDRTPVDVCQRRGVVTHLPAGTASCTLHWVDLAAGWEAAQLATTVREWRKRKGLLTHDGPRAPHAADPRSLRDRITDCRTVDQLTALYLASLDIWTDEDTLSAKAHRTWLEANHIS